MPVNATNTPSPYRAEMIEWAIENIPESSGFYIIHFERDICETTNRGARHYCGSAQNLRERFLQHLSGCSYGGSRLCEVANERGIKFFMSTALQTTSAEDARVYEEYFKKSVKDSPRYCSCCSGKTLPVPR